jgi:hypothetical protein
MTMAAGSGVRSSCLFPFNKIATGIATGRIKIDRDLKGRYSLLIAANLNKISTSGKGRDYQECCCEVFKTGALNHSATLPHRYFKHLASRSEP